ncbi:MAG: type II toxin-antitoxin system VapC family toxin [Candidatus Hydrothermarchaeales archaeon]
MLKIYLDTNVWSRPFDKPSQRMIEETNAFFDILEKSYKGSLAIVGSLVLDVEVGRTENLEKRAVTERIIAIFVSEHFQDIPSSKVREIKEATELKLPDATHLACAVEAGCKYFITCDDEIIKKGKEIERQYGLKIYNPVDFIGLEEEEW